MININKLLNKEKLSLIEFITYISLKFFSNFLTLLSKKTTFKLGRLFGLLMYIFFPLRKKVALINLKIAFPEKNNKEINFIIKNTYKHFGILILEFLKLHNYNPKDYVFNVLLVLIQIFLPFYKTFYMITPLILF